MRFVRPAGWIVFTCLAVATPPIAVHGQDEPEEPGEAPLRGVILDALTGTRLEGARVQLVDVRGGTLTDSLGGFELPGVPVGIRTVTVDHYGFEGLEVVLRVTPDMEPVVVELDPRPVMLEGFEVVTDRLAEMERRLRSRRRATATSIRAFDLERLTRSASGDMLEFLRFESMLHMSPCGRGGYADLCVLRRGRLSTPRVYIDEAPAVGGLDQLATYRPSELYLVEVYGRGLQIRAYTHNFMERMARRPMALIPIFW